MNSWRRYTPKWRQKRSWHKYKQYFVHIHIHFIHDSGILYDHQTSKEFSPSLNFKITFCHGGGPGAEADPGAGAQVPGCWWGRRDDSQDGDSASGQGQDSPPGLYRSMHSYVVMFAMLSCVGLQILEFFLLIGLGPGVDNLLIAGSETTVQGPGSWG